MSELRLVEVDGQDQQWMSEADKASNVFKRGSSSGFIPSCAASVMTVDSVDDEMQSLGTIMDYPQSDLSEETLLAIRWEDLIDQTQDLAPTTWRLFRKAAYTSRQDERNTMKNPDASVMTMVAVASFCRSHKNCKLAKLLTVYFNSCGISAKAFDTLNALGLTMSQKWAYDGLQHLAESACLDLLRDIRTFPFLGTHDNLNRTFKAYEQRLANSNHFDSGTTESSYDGNDRVLHEFFSQLGINTPAQKKEFASLETLVWVGDLLTTSRIRGLKKFRCEDLNSFERLDFLEEMFGWFHAQIAAEHSLHSQYYGTRAGGGLVLSFDILERKGLRTLSVQGDFHHHMKEALHHIAEARFRGLWMLLGKVDCLRDLRQKSPDELKKLAEQIVTNYSSTKALLLHAEKPRKKQDDVHSQAIQWNRGLFLCEGAQVVTGGVWLEILSCCSGTKREECYANDADATHRAAEETVTCGRPTPGQTKLTSW
ncbi:hypothetical protein EUX98_g1090 [Antrodiella citrinella]|uniref:DUF6589 domain-containing protein n=1 Tax=Antrodiella citrinella TaxID=2447956 RepID=A0A4S4N4P1_9APHY|nr:hypothetical protein EUX98_g1090 [Antrodiella citrinella]